VKPHPAARWDTAPYLQKPELRINAIVTLACQAMATRFELVLQGDDPVALRAAGEEALAEIERLEDQLSLYRPASEISLLNSQAKSQPVRVSPSLFALLQNAAVLHQASAGAFDITVAPLVRCWGFMGGTGRWPAAETLAEARGQVGMQYVQFDERNSTVQFTHPGVMLDLGAIGKGYAVEQAVHLLRESGVRSALLHGGTSTVYGMGHPADAPAWQVAVSQPQSAQNPQPLPLACVALKDQALSVSDISGRCFRVDGKVFGHIIDPRTGEPVSGNLLAAVVLPSATETDALSTALITLGPAGLDRLNCFRPNWQALIAHESAGRVVVQSQGTQWQWPSK
jgi:thiamine biosynthesis lipoprotein